MTRVQFRFKNVIQRLGEVFTVSSTGYNGIFSILSVNQAAVYIGGDSAAATPPIRAVYVPCDTSLTENSQLIWNSTSYKIRKVIELRFRGVNIAKMLILTDWTGGPSPAEPTM